jgi:hypothetical protein
MFFFEWDIHTDFRIGGGCDDVWICYSLNFRRIYTYFLPVYFLLSVVYAILHFRLKPNEGLGLGHFKKWLIVSITIFLSSLTIYALVAFSRGYISDLREMLLTSGDYVYELAIGKYRKLAGLALGGTILATWLEALAWPRLQPLSNRVILNFDFFAITFIMSIFLFCNVTMSYDMALDGGPKGQGFGFPYVWFVKRDVGIGLKYTNKLLFDFLLYNVIVNFLFWLYQLLRSNRVFYLRNNRILLFALVGLTLPSLLSNLKTVMSAIDLNLGYYCIKETIRVHIGLL